MSDRPRLFYNNTPCCNRLMDLIKDEDLMKDFMYHNVDDPNVANKLPESFNRVPILIVKGVTLPLIGKEVFNWIQSRKYLNIHTIDVDKSVNPIFVATPHIGKAYDTNAAAMEDADDKKMNTSLAYMEDWDKLRITSDLKRRFVDNKLSTEAQQRKLNELVSSRSSDLEKIMNQNKKF
jgi:hypothetical protein